MTRFRWKAPPGLLLVLILSLPGCADPPAPPPVSPPLVKHTVDVDGHPIAVWSRKAPGATRAMVLLHGRTWSALPDFDLQVEGEDLSFMEALVEEGFAAYAVDLRGYGDTPRDESGWLSPVKAAEDMEAVLAWVQEDFGAKPSFFGWSMGSLVAHLTVQRSPDLVSHLILFGYPWGAETNIPEGEDPEQPPMVTNTAEAAASDFITPGSISDEALAAYVVASLEADPVRVDWNRMYEFNVLDPAGLTVPTLLMHGEGDPFALIPDQQAVFTRLGTSDRQWSIVPGGDHAAILEKSRHYAIAAVIDFVTRPRD
jgi:pimeloyl-ACP methyl ester carboxylesterase